MKNETDALNEALINMQLKREMEKELLMQQWRSTYENLKPANYIKNKFKNGFDTSKMKNIILVTTIGLGTSYLIKRILVGNSWNPFRKLFGYYIQYKVAKYIFTHTDLIKSVGVKLFDRSLKQKSALNADMENNHANLFI